MNHFLTESLDANTIRILLLFGMTIAISAVMVVSGYIGLRRTSVGDTGNRPASITAVTQG